jgi:Tol biopolymer transport system component
LTAFAVLFLASPLDAEAGKVRFGDSAEPGHVDTPVWSPDGKYVAFEANDLGGGVDMYVAEISGDIAKDGTKVTLPMGRTGGGVFGGAKHVASNASWHPDGFVVFQGSNQGGEFRLYLYQPRGQAAHEMIQSTQVPGNLTMATMSDDGSKLAFVSSHTGNGDIYIRDSNSGEVKRITSGEGTEAFPTFSSDGSRMLFTRKKNDLDAIFEVDLASGVEREIAAGNGSHTRPTYGANGAVVHFSAERGDSIWDLVVRTNGVKKVLARDIRLPLRARPTVGSKGQWVAVASDDPSKSDGVMLIKIDGSKTVKVPTSFKGCGDPAISWNGDRMILAYTALPASGSDWRFLQIEDVTDWL